MQQKPGQLLCCVLICGKSQLQRLVSTTAVCLNYNDPFVAKVHVFSFIPFYFVMHSVLQKIQSVFSNGAEFAKKNSSPVDFLCQNVCIPSNYTVPPGTAGSVP